MLKIRLHSDAVGKNSAACCWLGNDGDTTDAGIKLLDASGGSTSGQLWALPPQFNGLPPPPPPPPVVLP